MLAVPRPELSVVIPTWNQIRFTRACVDSLRRNTDVAFELIIVDNGSDPADAEEAKALADRFIGNATNLGFARAMNQGLAVARGEVVAFVNNDTELPASWASRLLATLAAQPRPGIVLPAVTAAGNQAAVRQSPADRQTIFRPFTAIPSGVIYLLVRETMVELGGWNEQYGVASAEDLDLLFTVWANGLSVVLDEQVLVKHESAASAVKLPDREAIYAENRLAFAARWANADPDSVPRLTTCPKDAFAANLETARVAGIWMEKWFTAMDIAAAETRARQAAARKLAARKLAARKAAASQATAQPPGFTSRLARKMRRVRARIMK